MVYTAIISQANQAPMPAAFFTPVKHFHYSYFFTNFGITRVKIWRKWTYILVINWNWYCPFTWPMNHSFKEKKETIGSWGLSKPFRTHQNCHVDLMFLFDWFCTIVHNTPVVPILSKRGCLSFKFVSKLAKYVNDSNNQCFVNFTK